MTGGEEQPAMEINDTLNSYEEWIASPEGTSIETRTHELVLSLLPSAGGKRFLGVGCKTGRDLVFFRNLGYLVTGTETSRVLIDAARQKISPGIDLHLGDSEDLPFSDDEFDVVTMLTSLEATENPLQALREAVRVSRARVVLTLINHASPFAQRIRATSFPAPAFHSFGVFEAIRLVRAAMPGVPVEWGSIVFFPACWYPRAEGIDRKIPWRKNPFGSIAGISFPVTYHFRTLQEPLGANVEVRLRENRRVAGTACNRER